MKAGLFRRYFALALDPLIAYGLYFLGIALLGGATGSLGGAFVAALVLPFVYLIWWLSLFRKGQTPGKKVLSVQVVRHQTGAVPGFGKMFVREVFGKFVSALFLCLGFFWALIDDNNQAWHDKLAGTVVIRTTGHRALNEPQQRQQKIESGPAATKLPEKSSAAEEPVNVAEAEDSTSRDTEAQTDVNRRTSTLQNESSSQSVRSSSSTESLSSTDEQFQSGDQHESQSSSNEEHEGEWRGDEYWKHEDDELG